MYWQTIFISFKQVFTLLGAKKDFHAVSKNEN